ncbi:MAG: hypothetical protein O3A00_16585 [Planctomycetota bacterium]|nr:hypothetical protein [Planctomycetota bacterium]
MTTATSAIESSTVYPLRDFQRLAGLGNFALREARKKGLRVRAVGNRRYILGSDFREFLESQPERGSAKS